MTEYIAVRASRILNQHELIDFSASRFPDSVKLVGAPMPKGLETFEVAIPTASPRMEELRDFIATRREQGVRAFAAFTIGVYRRKYTEAELQSAEILKFRIRPHFEPAGDDCGTIYETLCSHSNLGRQLSDLILDLRRVPKKKDVAVSIALVEWVVSSKLVHAFTDERLSGAKFRPVLDVRNPVESSRDWHQLEVVGSAGAIAKETLLGIDPFSASDVDWRCPSGHSVAAQILSEVYLNRDAWDGSDIAATTSLFGQGMNLLRPTPVLFISQRAYKTLQRSELKGYSVEVAHLL